MPNKRAKNKVFFGGFIDHRVKARLTKAARAAGMRANVFGFAMGALEERLEQVQRSRSKQRYRPRAHEDLLRPGLRLTAPRIRTKVR